MCQIFECCCHVAMLHLVLGDTYIKNSQFKDSDMHFIMMCPICIKFSCKILETYMLICDKL